MDDLPEMFDEDGEPISAETLEVIKENTANANLFLNRLLVQFDAHNAECPTKGTRHDNLCAGDAEFQAEMWSMVETIGPIGCVWILIEAIRRISRLSDPTLTLFPEGS